MSEVRTGWCFEVIVNAVCWLVGCFVGFVLHLSTPMLVTIYGGERPRAAAFGSDPRPFLESSYGLRPLPSAAAFGQFQRRSLFETNKKKRSRLPALGYSI